jgi:hypothetical protein
MKPKAFKGVIQIAAALAFVTAAGSAMAGHTLQIKLDGSASNSLFVVGDSEWGQPIGSGFCVTAPAGGFPRGWFPTAYRLRDGSNVKVIAFASGNCTNGYRRDKQMTVPRNDHLQNVYLNLF